MSLPIQKPDPSATLIFLHIPKTGGSSLRQVLARQFRPSEGFGQVATSREGRRRFLEDLASLPEEEQRKIRLVRGHLWFGVHELLSQPSTYVTLLRDPVERVLSSYYHWVRRRGLSVSLEDWMTIERPLPADNDQTRRLSGFEDLGFGEVTPEILERAKRNLADRFALAGLTERFDETVLLLKGMFRWRNVRYMRRNVGVNRPPVIGREVRQLIEERNEFDRELYRFAAVLFEDRLASAPIASSELQRFRRVNTVYQGAWRLAAPVAGPVWRRVRPIIARVSRRRPVPVSRGSRFAPPR